MKKNDVISLQCDNLGADMEGVCRHDGMPVFVPGLLPSEEADVRIIKIEKRFAFGRVDSPVAHPSTCRRAPDCDAYPQCGGCTARHMSYEATLHAKRQQIRDCFQRIGHLEVDVPPVLGMDRPFAYRNKTTLPIGGSASEPVLGFFAPRSHRIIPAVHCPNAMDPATKIAEAVQFWIRTYRIPPYQEQDHQGLLRHLVIRVNRRHEAMVTLVTTQARLPHAGELIHLLSQLGVISIYLNENPKHTNVIFGERFHPLHGSKTLTDTLCNLQFDLSPASFFQINPSQTEVLYQTILDFASPSPQDMVCDVYCGAGTISLMMARHCAQVTGIEIVPAAVHNARENAVRNHISNAVFYEGKAEALLPRMISDGLRPQIIVVDPPRKGLEPDVIHAIAQASPDRLIYVSCNPATQARDAALLHDLGYDVQQIQPVDMFPYTSHIETVCLLTSPSFSIQ